MSEKNNVFTSLEIVENHLNSESDEAEPWIQLRMMIPGSSQEILVTMGAYAMMQMLAGLVLEINNLMRERITTHEHLN